MSVLRGQVYLVDFSRDATGSMQKIRPAVIVQNDTANLHSPYTIITPIKHDSPKHLPVHVVLQKGQANLWKDSVVDCGHIHTLYKTRLKKLLGFLPATLMTQIDHALGISLALPH